MTSSHGGFHRSPRTRSSLVTILITEPLIFRSWSKVSWIDTLTCLRNLSTPSGFDASSAADGNEPEIPPSNDGFRPSLFTSSSYLSLIHI